jgi:hypothetical protein
MGWGGGFRCYNTLYALGSASSFRSINIRNLWERTWKQRLSAELLYIIYKALCLNYGRDKAFIILGVLSFVEGDEGELIILNSKLYESLKLVETTYVRRVSRNWGQGGGAPQVPRIWDFDTVVIGPNFFFIRVLSILLRV